MFGTFARKLALCSALLAVVTPAAFASSPLGTDPEPHVIHAILVLLGLG